jgi:hypothetical protein
VITVEAGPLNGPDDADAAMAWVNITSWVNDNLQTVTTSEGRQTELSQVDAGNLTLLVNNQDHRFTPGNLSSPYAPGWRTGMRIRVRETLGYQTFTHFDGNMLQPDMTINTPGLDQTVTVSATDRLGRLSTSRTLISTLAEWIIYNGGSGLKAFYPLGESRAPLRDAVGGHSPMTVAVGLPITGSTGATTPLVTFGAGTDPAGDDLRPPRFSPQLDASQMVLNYASLVANWSTPIPQASGETLTVAAWVMLNNTTLDQIFPFGITGSDISLQYDRSGIAPYPWSADVSASLTTATVPVPAPVMPAALVALRLTLPSGAVEVWSHTADPLTSTLSGAGPIPSSAIWTSLFAGSSMAGSIAHAQVYVGANAYTRQMHLDQIDVGLTGLAGQYAGDRIRTIARYAGVADGDMDIDPGTSRMQVMSLAGRSPLAVMQEAATTEQGLLHARGRRLLFHDRLRRYNR